MPNEINLNGPVDGSIISPIVDPTTPAPPPVGGGPDSGTSTIEESKNVAQAYVPPLNFPILAIPTNEGTLLVSMTSAIGSSHNSEAIKTLLSSATLRSDIINDMLDKWMENLREIDEENKKRINSSDYLVQQQIRLHGTQPLAGVIVQNAVDALNQIVSHKIDRVDATHRADGTHKIDNRPSTNYVEQKASDEVVIETAMVTSIVAGAVALGVVSQVSAEGSVSGFFANAPQMISQIDRTIPQNIVADSIMMINLMVAPLIFFKAWDAAVGNVGQKAEKANMQLAEGFAKEVFKICGDDVLLLGILSKVAGAETLPPEKRSQLIAMIKLVLTVHALALLYIAEAGKVSPQEILGMLKGEIAIPPGDLKATLVKMIKNSLQDLTPAERARTLEAVFEYLDSEPGFEKMLKPAEVFHHVLDTSAFHLEQQGIENSPIGKA